MFNKIYEIVLGRGSAAPTMLRGGSMAPETLRNTSLDSRARHFEIETVGLFHNSMYFYAFFASSKCV
jgi:hypothetical protein